MLRNIADEMLNDEKSTMRWFRANHPDEQIVFASTASYHEFTQGSRRGWGRRGVVILTHRQIFFRSVYLSLFTLVFLSAALISFAVYYRTQEVLFLVVSIMAVAATFNRLPLQRPIPLGDIEKVELASTRSFTLRGLKEFPLLKIVVHGNMVHFTLGQVLPEEAERILQVSDERTSEK